ncbi:hypothetical protein ElyMa_001613200 [Elysia marginata]|uniref:Uncharacterized protein n=1 Tax=Elysia marginata TaxID=1093978 RepID=A0AAV4JL68_9GAST|nr:hypothetical protein ElyMa_001613200 [Elysia marginata]
MASDQMSQGEEIPPNVYDTLFSNMNKLSIDQVDLKDKRVLISRVAADKVVRNESFHWVSSNVLEFTSFCHHQRFTGSSGPIAGTEHRETPHSDQGRLGTSSSHALSARFCSHNTINLTQPSLEPAGLSLEQIIGNTLERDGDKTKLD